MADIIIKDDTVEVTVTYKSKFTNEHEMLESIKAARDLRDMARDETQDPNEQTTGEVA